MINEYIYKICISYLFFFIIDIICSYMQINGYFMFLYLYINIVLEVLFDKFNKCIILKCLIMMFRFMSYIDYFNNSFF